MRDVLCRTVLGLLTALLLAAGAAGAGAKRSIAITGTKVSGVVVTVNVRISGWKMYPALVGKKTKSPDGGHWHIYVDGKYAGFSANSTTGKTKASSGAHSLYVELANNDHSSLTPRVRSRSVSVTVGREPPPPDEPPPGGYPGDYGP